MTVSVRVYSGPHSDRGRPRNRWVTLIPWVLTGLVILGQILWVLFGAEGRRVLSILTVVGFFLASATHAWLARGAAWAAGYLGITLGIGFAVEALGVATAFPFGDYEYTDALGPALLGVPLLIPMAWAMMAYPCLLAVQRMTTTGLGTALMGGFLLASWDLFLDPQMTGEGYWSFSHSGWELPGIPGIPLQNYLGWFLTAFLMMLALDRLPRKAAKDAVPMVLLSWTYASSVLANLAFFGRPWVALIGGVAMGLVVIPWWWRIWSQPQW